MKSFFQGLKNAKFFLLLIIIPFCLSLFWFRNGYVMGGGESGLPFFDLNRQFEILKYTWTDIGLGNSYGVLVGATPLFKFLSWVSSFGIQGFKIELFFLFLMFVIAGISVWFLTKEIFPDLDDKYLFLSSAFYWFNPISLVTIWNRFLYNSMVFWAFLPLALFLFLRGIKRHDFKYALLVAISSAIFAYALTSVVFIMLLWGLFIYVLFFHLIFEAEGKFFKVLYTLLTFVGFITFNFWWIAQFFVFIFSSNYDSATSVFFTSFGNLSTLTALSIKLGQISDLLRFMHGSFFIDGPIWARIYAFSPLSLVEFFAAGVILWCIYKFREKKEVLLFGSLFILSLFLAKGNSIPFGELFQILFVKLPPLQVFRNPFEKFSFLILLTAAPLFTFGINKLIFFIVKQRYKNLLLSGAFIFIIGFWGFPFWTGLVFTSNQGMEASALRNYEVNPPEYYKEANDRLSNNGVDSRFVSLPLGGEAIDYSWKKPYSGVELSALLFQTPNISFNTTIPFYSDLVSQLIKYQLDKEILNFFPFINSKYILWREDIKFKQRGMADPAIMRLQLDTWENEGLVRKVRDVGKLTIYEIKSDLIWPKIYTTNNQIFVNDNDLNDLSKFIPGFPNEKVAFLSINNTEPKNIDGKFIISSKTVYSQRVTTPLPKDLSDQDLLGKLFYVKHLPGEWPYFFIRIKEKFDEMSQADYLGKLIYRNGIIGKRAVEIYKLRKGGANKNLVKSIEKEYKNNLQEFTPTILSLTKQNTPVANLIKNSLIYQWFLLERSGSADSEELSKLLIDWGIKPKFELPISNMNYEIFTFDVPETKNYNIETLGTIKNTQFYIDGKLISGVYATNEVEINKGEHEIAFLLDNKSFSPLDINEDTLNVSQRSLPDWKIYIPSIQTKYKIEFDYRFVKGEEFNLKFAQNIDGPNSAVWGAGIRKEKDFHGWKSWDGEFTSSPGASNGILSFLPAEEQVCRRSYLILNVCGLEKQDFEVEIRNFKLSKVELSGTFLVSSGVSDKANSDTHVEYTKVNPTEYKVRVDKKDSVPEVLVFSELFNSGWQAKFDDGTKISENSHFLVNAFANGWVIEKAGNYQLTLKFYPQDLEEKGIKISVLSITIGLILLTILIWRKKIN